MAESNQKGGASRKAAGAPGTPRKNYSEHPQKPITLKHGIGGLVKPARQAKDSDVGTATAPQKVKPKRKPAV